METAVPNPAVMAFQRKLLSPDSGNKMGGQNGHNIE
jgi:hypothetical protein